MASTLAVPSSGGAQPDTIFRQNGPAPIRLGVEDVDRARIRQKEKRPYVSQLSPWPSPPRKYMQSYVGVSAASPLMGARA